MTTSATATLVTIAPLPEGTARPFWSVMIPAYMRVTYLAQTLASVLDQDPGEERMQIEVVDNGSPTAEIENLVRSIGRGRVTYFRQASNVGLVGNWNTCINRSRGHWIHILHDDDVAMSGYYAAY